MTKPRETWMDLVRGGCIMLVVLYHTTVPLEVWAGVALPDAIATFNKFFIPFRMPVLMFLSGLLLQKSLDKPPRDFFLGKFNLIYWPFLIWSLPILAADDRLTLINLLKLPISAPTLLWYLWFLVAYYYLAWVIVRLRIPVVLVILASLVASAFLPSLVRMDRFAALFVFFMAGYAMTRFQLAERIRPWMAALGLIAALVIGVISVTATQSIRYDPLFVWGPLGAICAIVFAGRFYSTTRLTAPLEWVGRNSIVFYVTHFPLIVVTVRVLVPQGSSNGGWIYLALFVWAIAVGAAVQLARERAPAVQALFDFKAARRLVRRRPVAADATSTR